MAALTVVFGLVFPQEASNINRSLMCLGQVIMALVDVSNGKNRHICYRDSKLTFLLRVCNLFKKIEEVLPLSNVNVKL